MGKWQNKFGKARVWREKGHAVVEHAVHVLLRTYGVYAERNSGGGGGHSLHSVYPPCLRREFSPSPNRSNAQKRV